MDPWRRIPDGGGGGGSASFTALLGLPAGRAMELLCDASQQKLLEVPPAAFHEPAIKAEADSEPAIPIPTQKKIAKSVRCSDRAGANAVGKKPRKEAAEDEQLPYVHVRARRGQATDSHSLAERARREKINARMKLLQELVPGCSKVSGTAQVLDEIINHVQSLQRQVEFLSMRLAAVNPTGIHLGGGVEGFLSGVSGSLQIQNKSPPLISGWAAQAAAWAEPQRQVRLADLLPKQSLGNHHPDNSSVAL